MNNDLTIIFYTANKVQEPFASRVRDHLVRTTKGKIPIISVSQKPLDFGLNICVGDIGFSLINIYRQALIGALATRNPYIAMCEDDCLYTPGHFEYRPPEDAFGYNLNRWTLFTWSKTPLYSFRNRMVFSQCIAPRELYISAMTERFLLLKQPISARPDKMPPPLTRQQEKYFAEPGRYEGHLGVEIQKVDPFKSPEPNVVFSHMEALGALKLGVKKRMGHPRLERLEPWGPAEDLIREYFGEEEHQRQKGFDKWVNA